MRDQSLVASVALVLGGALWGLIWIPLRALGDMGLVGAWPGMFLYVGSTIIMLPYAAWRFRALLGNAGPLIVAGLLTGAAFSLYSTAVLLTDVVRTLLLFYLTPVWGTIIGWLILGERITPARMLALGLSLVGLMVVLGIGKQFPWPSNLGDWMALASGLCWALGSVAVFKLKSASTGDKMFAFVVGSVVITSITLAFGGPEIGSGSSGPPIFDNILLLIIAGLYVMPMIFLTIWPASLLSPGRVGILLMSDALVGIISAAWLAGEVFGVREFVGTILIVSAALVEVLGNRTQPTIDNSSAA